MSAPTDSIAAAIADPNINTGWDYATVASLLHERDISETTISTVERPEGFRVGFRDGEVVELS